MKRISPSLYLWQVIVLAFLLIAVFAALNWVVDPLQFYRRASYFPDFASQSRYQNPGLARNYPYDSIIAGTSVSLGFKHDQIRETLGWQELNLAMSGASAHEQSLILEVALRTGRVRHVLWDVNHEYLRGEPDWVSDYDGAFPANFYDTNPWNEIPSYLLNVDTTKATARVLLQRAGLHLYRTRPLDDLSRLENVHPFGKESVLQSIQRMRKMSSVFQDHPEDFAPEKLRRSFEENYLRQIREHPDVTFELWFPPFSIARHAVLRETAPAVWDGMFHWKEDVLRAITGLPNVRLHDFQGDAEVVLNLDHYMDTLHFDDAVRNRIANAVISGVSVASPESLSKTEQFLRREAAQFQTK